jgi:hypothetical protein
MMDPSYIARISPEDTVRIQLANQRIANEFASYGHDQANIAELIQTNFSDVSERKSFGCAYEQLRAQYLLTPILLNALNNQEKLFLLTVGRPQDRIDGESLEYINLENLNRHFRRAVAKLRIMGIKNLKIFAVNEVHLVEPLHGDAYWEPHLHVIASGATAEQLKEAFKVRKLAATDCRKRPLHVQPITDLEGAIGYCLKFKPTKQVQYRSGSSVNTSKNDLTGEYLFAWYTIMATTSRSELLKFVGINADALNKPLTCELSLSLSEIPRGWL